MKFLKVILIFLLFLDLDLSAQTRGRTTKSRTAKTSTAKSRAKSNLKKKSNASLKTQSKNLVNREDEPTLNSNFKNDTSQGEDNKSLNSTSLSPSIQPKVNNKVNSSLESSKRETKQEEPTLNESKLRAQVNLMPGATVKNTVLVNFFIGFGLGSFIQGDVEGGLIGFIGDILSIASITGGALLFEKGAQFSFYSALGLFLTGGGSISFLALKLYALFRPSYYENLLYKSFSVAKIFNKNFPLIGFNYSKEEGIHFRLGLIREL